MLLSAVAKWAGRRTYQWGAAASNVGSAASNVITRKGMTAGAYGLAKGLGQKGGFIAGGALKGGMVGGAAGLGMWGVTGNSDWAMVGAGMGAWMGGAGRHLAQKSFYQGAKKAGRGFGALNRRTGWGIGVGAAIGVATDNPAMALGGGLAVGAAPIAWKWGLSPKGLGTMAKGMAQAPFAPTAAMKTFSKLPMNQAVASTMFPGLILGGGYAAFKGATGYGSSGRNEVTSGYFPGGVTQLSNGGRGIGNNHLSTEGLTLALHKNAHGTRVM